jgi:hypothetical protein
MYIPFGITLLNAVTTPCIVHACDCHAALIIFSPVDRGRKRGPRARSYRSCVIIRIIQCLVNLYEFLAVQHATERLSSGECPTACDARAPPRSTSSAACDARAPPCCMSTMLHVADATERAFERAIERAIERACLAANATWHTDRSHRLCNEEQHRQASLGMSCVPCFGPPDITIRWHAVTDGGH